LISVTTIIYAAIDDLKDAMEGMLLRNEEILGTAEIRDISKFLKLVLLQVVWLWMVKLQEC
jgi:translation initiation factor IF-2